MIRVRDSVFGLYDSWFGFVIRRIISNHHMIRESYDSWFDMNRRIRNPNQESYKPKTETRTQIIFESPIILVLTESRIRITNRFWPNPNHEYEF